MICARCGGTNFQWASTCDRCGHPLDAAEPAAAASPVPPDGQWVDRDAVLERDFHAHLDATTPDWYVTTALVVVNVAVFVLMVSRGVSATSPASDVLMRWGANYGPLTVHGQWWRLLTCAFVHIGITHLVMNMIVLWTGGRLTERLFGQPAFVALYALSALGGSIASIAAHPMTTSAGASGAIFGVYGGVIAFVVVRRSALPKYVRSEMLQNAVLFVGYNVLYGLTQPHVDVAAHIGGLATGLVVGAVLAPPVGASVARGWQRPLAVTGVAFAVFAVAASRLPAFDNWTSALSHWIAVSVRIDARYEEAVTQLEKKSLTREQFADRIEKTLVPEILVEQKKFSALRLPPAERVVANKIEKALALRSEALTLTASGERTGDPAVLEQADVKREEALAASLTIVPNAALQQQLATRSKDRAQQRAFAAELIRLGELDKGAFAVYRDAVTRVRDNHLPPSEFALKIEHDILGPWQAERQRIATLAVPDRQKPVRQRLLEYMDLRTEAWQLIATGARTNDGDKMKHGNEKHAAAAKLLAAPPEKPAAADQGAPGKGQK